jgi:NADH-quinone oxidoreductase subunit F
MNFQQVLATSSSKCSYLNDPDCAKICIRSKAHDSNTASVLDSIESETNKHGIKASIITTGSFGYYDLEPILSINRPGQAAILYKNISPEIVSSLINDFFIHDNPRPDIALCNTGNAKIEGIPSSSDLPLFQLQNRIALRNCGNIDPENIDHYIQRGGYSGLSRALQMNQIDIIEELRKAGLRGRGSGCFTVDKWNICHDAEAAEKYIICNAVDADPQAFTARLLLDSDPHSVLEGMLIGAYAVGASRCIVYLDAGHDVAISGLKKVFEQMREYSLLGDNILDSTFSAEIELREVTASLVSGEETAILRFMEGRQAMPYVRPTYPSADEFDGKPTLINNLETLSSVSAIFQNGAEWFSNIGTAKSKGTKVITLSGDITHRYTVEVPFGTTLLGIVENIGGGVPDGKAVKAVQLGGPTGALFAADSLDVPVDYESMGQLGSIIGSGTLKVFDSDSCAVEMTRDITSYIHTQSCGKCVFCREGSLQLSDILQDIAECKGKPQDLDLLVELGEAMKTGCICSIGQTAANPVLSSIKLFHSDYDAHIREQRCPMDKHV